MKNNSKNHKPAKERLETLASVAGRNLPQELVREVVEIEQRTERLERLFRKYAPLLKLLEENGEMVVK